MKPSIAIGISIFLIVLSTVLCGLFVADVVAIHKHSLAYDGLYIAINVLTFGICVSTIRIAVENHATREKIALMNSLTEARRRRGDNP